MFCDGCSPTVQPGQAFCSRCGQQIFRTNHGGSATSAGAGTHSVARDFLVCHFGFQRNLRRRSVYSCQYATRARRIDGSAGLSTSSAEYGRDRCVRWSGAGDFRRVGACCTLNRRPAPWRWFWRSSFCSFIFPWGQRLVCTRCGSSCRVNLSRNMSAGERSRRLSLNLRLSPCNFAPNIPIPQILLRFMLAAPPPESNAGRRSSVGRAADS
jgi:hypothetical protein